MEPMKPPGKREMKKELKKLRKQQKRARKKEKKFERVQHRIRWKKQKREMRRELREKYKDAPFPVRFYHLFFKKILIGFGVSFVALTFLGIVAGVVFEIGLFIYDDYLDEKRDEPVEDVSILYELSPLDEEGAKRIDAIPEGGKDDTWTICVYMVGADLEDDDENDLSEATIMETAPIKAERDEQKKAKKRENLGKFSEELRENNLGLPEFLYYPQKPVAYSEYMMNEVIVSDRMGAGTNDLYEMMEAELSDQVKIVVQTGGATRWSYGRINPNKTQRFLLDKDGFREIENLPLQMSTDPDTLSDFIRYCKSNYEADHMMLIFWDHGGGPTGFGVDSIFGGDTMSIAQIREALQNSCKPDSQDAPFDIIGFDACLMSTIEVTHSLRGFADYYVLSQELEPREGWNYTAWLNDLCGNPSASGAMVGRYIADSYMNFYMTRNHNIGKYFQYDVTMSVLDAKKCETVYEAYNKLAKAQLMDAASDISVLAEIGRCGNKSTHYADYAHSVVNLADLGNYASFMVDSYPEESSEITNAIEDAVLYHRQNGVLSEATGLSFYIPSTVDSVDGLLYFLEYENDICDDQFVKTLYYYKMAGCLNPELKNELAKITKETPTVLNVDLFKSFVNKEVKIEGTDFEIQVEDELQRMIQNYDFQIALYDDEMSTVTYYGSDNLAYFDGEGNMRVEFDGTWMHLNGVPLSTEISFANDTSMEFCSKVLYNGEPAYLVFYYVFDTEEFVIKGVRKIPEDDPDSLNFMTGLKQDLEIKEKDEIIPIYQTSDLRDDSSDEVQGKKIKIKGTPEIKMEPLDSGYYLGMINIYDQRGDCYFSKVVGYTMSGKKLKEVKVDEDFFGTNY